MQLSNKQSDLNHFNDYVINSPGGNTKFLPAHQRCQSSNSIYYQQGGLSRKKLTVVSRDNLRPDFKGDYHMPENGSSLSSSNRTRLQNIGYSPLRANQSTHNTTQNTIQHHDSLKNSRVIKSKLKRPISPSPMTPTKILKLKRSMLNEKNQQSFVSTNRINQQQQLNSVQRSLSRRKFESNQVSPIKIHLQSSNHRRMLSARNDCITSPQHTLRQHNQTNHLLQDVKKQLMSTFNIKLLQIQSRMQFQQQTIKILQSRISDNNRKLKDKQRQIEDMMINSSREKSKTTFSYQQQQNVSLNGKEMSNNRNNLSNNKSGQNDSYLLKKMKDIQSKFYIVMKQQDKLKSSQIFIDQKISTLQYDIVTFNSSKLNAIKTQLTQFLSQKSQTLSLLNESISYLDNKLIGRTQAIKELLCELKEKVKQVEDTWTHKQSRATKQSTTLGLKQSEDLSIPRTINARRVQIRLKQLTSVEDKRPILKTSPQQQQVQGSLQFSLTSYDQDQLRMNNIKNVYYDYNEMSDMSVGLLQNCVKDQSSRLTDDFYYPGGSMSRHISSMNISPIVGKRQYGQQQQLKQKQVERQNKVSQFCSDAIEIKDQNDSNNNRFIKKQQLKNNDRLLSPINKTKNNINQNQNESSPASQTTIKISHQTINKKIQCIQQLISTKKVTSCQEIQKGQLRCYVDKTGYLKYTDSKTFVFDKKGNLIPCTEGEFWFLVTKGLIYGKRDDDDSRTVSYIEVDE